MTLALCLVSWIDSHLHFENYKQSTAGKLSKEPLTVPSIVRQAQYNNLEAFVGRFEHRASPQVHGGAMAAGDNGRWP